MEIGGADHHNSTKFTRFMALLGCSQMCRTTSQDCLLIKSHLAAAAWIFLAQCNVCTNLWSI